MTILKDTEDAAFHDEPADTASVSQSTTKVSALPKSGSKFGNGSGGKKPVPVSVLQIRPPDEEQCKSFNADLLRTLVSRKMAKQKTFYELKVQPQHAPVIINNLNQPQPLSP